MTACLPASVSPRRACPSPRSRRLEMRPASFLDLQSHLAGFASVGTKVESLAAQTVRSPSAGGGAVRRFPSPASAISPLGAFSLRPTVFYTIQR